MATQHPGGAARLTPAMRSRALLVLDFVRDYIARWGHAPSQREIANGLKIERTTVRRSLRRLARDRLVILAPGARGISLPGEVEQAIATLSRAGFMLEGMATVHTLPPPVLDYPPETSPQARKAA